MELLPEDVFNIILYKLSINDICNIFSTNKYFNNIIFSWQDYLEINIPNKFDNVDEEFMKTHGKYLIKINKSIDTNQWLYFFPTIIDIDNYIRNNPNFHHTIEFALSENNNYYDNLYIEVDELGNKYSWPFMYSMFKGCETKLDGLLIDNMIDMLISYGVTSLLLSIKYEIIIVKEL